MLDRDDFNWSNLDYPQGAEKVRNLIREALRPKADDGSSMDTGGGFGSADLWVKIDGVEYSISVRGPSSGAPTWVTPS